MEPMEKVYPSCRYRPSDAPEGFDTMMVDGPDSEPGDGWYESPADFGVETCPGVFPDADILANRSGSAGKLQRPADDPGSLARTPQDPQQGTQAAPQSGPDSTSEPLKRTRRSKL